MDLVEEAVRKHKTKRDANKPIKEQRQIKEEDINPKKLKLYFYFERMEPFKWPEPRDLNQQLSSRMIKKYKGEPISKISLGTELILKYFKDEPVLKYKVIILDWDVGLETRNMKKIIFTEKMFRWTKDEENYGIFDV